MTYRQTTNMSRTLVGNEIVDHSDVAGASPVGAAPTKYIFILDLTHGFNGLGKDNCKTRRETFKIWVFGVTYIRGLTVVSPCRAESSRKHYNDVIMTTMASQIASLTVVYSTVYSDADQRKHQSSTSLAFVRGIHRGPVNSPHKGPVTRKMFPFDDVIMKYSTFLHFLIEFMKWRRFSRCWPFVRGIQRLPVDCPHKWPIVRLW